MEQKNNTGAIFKNDKKTAENQPDYRGKMMVNAISANSVSFFMTAVV